MTRIYPRYAVTVHVVLVGAPDVTPNSIATAINDVCAPVIRTSLKGNDVIIENITTDARMIDGLRGEA
jgi:hypothetical protein